MAKIEIYTKDTCGYCMMAKRLLSRKGAAFDEYPIAGDAEKRQEMVQRSGGGMTVPQIFIDGTPIGGFDDLNALDRAGKLDPLLAA